MSVNVLLFPITQNGDGSVYRQCTQSHRQYKHGYKDILFDRPNWVNSVSESARLRLPIIPAGLQNQYDRVVYVDADCEVWHNTLAIQSVEKANKSICLVRATQAE